MKLLDLQYDPETFGDTVAVHSLVDDLVVTPAKNLGITITKIVMGRRRWQFTIEEGKDKFRTVCMDNPGPSCKGFKAALESLKSSLTTATHVADPAPSSDAKATCCAAPANIQGLQLIASIMLIADADMPRGTPISINFQGKCIPAKATRAGASIPLGITLNSVEREHRVCVLLPNPVIRGVLSDALPGTIYWVAKDGGFTSTRPFNSDCYALQVGVAINETDLLLMMAS